MPEQEAEYVEQGVEHIRNLVKLRSLHSEVDWARIKEKLAEHASAKTPLEEAAAKVFLDYVAPKLFLAGEAQTPTEHPGLQTKVTPEIENFVLDTLRYFKTKETLEFLRRNPESMLPAVNKLMNEIYNFERVPLEGNVAKRLYAKQTARDVIATKRVPTTSVFSFGCAHSCVALAAALKALGIKTTFVRTLQDYKRMLEAPKLVKPSLRSPHSLVLFELGGRKYIADPWGHRKAMLLKPEMDERIAELKRERWWSEGENMWSMGITSYKYFTKGLNLPKYVKRYLMSDRAPGKPPRGVV
jgi:hypothetical protein